MDVMVDTSMSIYFCQRKLNFFKQQNKLSLRILSQKPKIHFTLYFKEKGKLTCIYMLIEVNKMM